MYKRFVREAESEAGLDHPGIVPVYGFGHHDERPYIVTQLMAESLEERLNEIPDIDTAVGWMIDIADAADFAHQCGVVHRDLKPGNVLFDREGRPRLADFGLAGLIDDSSLTGTGMYWAPLRICRRNKLTETNGFLRPAIFTRWVSSSISCFADKNRLMAPHPR